ncbi:uncharacterized protein TNCV_4674801 [Trichonephila clavipes]|nr:uncharacterized protein TNCV_4674801 [Trichonephila clavipes]
MATKNFSCSSRFHNCTQDYVERRLSERLLSGASNIHTKFFPHTCTVYEYVFEQCVFKRKNLKNAWNKLWLDLEGKKDFNDNHRDEEITNFVQSITGFQEWDGDVETWMACNAEDYEFQMLNDDEIVISVQGESDPVDDETDEDENNNESSKCPSNADAFSALETAVDWTHRQHYDPKLRYLPKKKPSPRLFRSISFVIFPFLPFLQPFKTSGAVHSSPLTLSHWWAYVSQSAASEAISYTVVWPDYCLSSLTGTKVQTLNKR